MKLAREIINSDVYSESENQEVAKIKSLVIDPANGKLIGFVIYGKRVRKKFNLININNTKLEDGVIIIKSIDMIERRATFKKADKTLKSKIKIFGSKVISESGQYIGRVYDYAIDEVKNKLARIYVSKVGFKYLFGTPLIISEDRIISIEKGKIIVKDLEQKVLRPKTVEQFEIA